MISEKCLIVRSNSIQLKFEVLSDIKKFQFQMPRTHITTYLLLLDNGLGELSTTVFHHYYSFQGWARCRKFSPTLIFECSLTIIKSLLSNLPYR